jgi:hypothetical protein
MINQLLQEKHQIYRLVDTKKQENLEYMQVESANQLKKILLQSVDL